MRSLRARLLVGIVGGMVLLLVVFSAVIYTAIRRALVKQFDVSLAATAQVLAAAVELEDDELDLEFDVQKMPEFQRAERSAYYQFWRHDGTVAARSPSLGTDDLLQLEGPLGAAVFGALQMRDGRPGRAVGFKFRPGTDGSDSENYQQLAEQETLTLVVARDAGDLQYRLQFLRWLLLIVSVGAITLSLLVAAFVVRRGLRPLNSLAVEIADITEDDLAVRIGTESVPAEVAPIRKRLNDLLSRLEASFNRERRFTTDIAHELRTPLAGMRSTLEVTLKRIRDTNEYQASLSDCLTITKSMQAMVNNLLALARLDAHQMTFRCDRIQLAELVNSCWQSFSDRAVERGIVFENRLPAEMSCESDTEGLSMVLSNLLDNAVEYTNEGGQIWTAGRQADDSVEITVANTGCRLTKEEVSRVFDCFWRGDSSRTDTGVHCGLGLALVQRMVRALGGSTCACVTRAQASTGAGTIVEVENGGTFTIRLTLPAPAPAFAS